MNIAEILSNKPKGTKLYSLIHGELNLEFIASGDNSIHCKNKYGIEVGFRENGHYYNDYNNDGECLLFPSKQMRDWEKFQWKKGDVLATDIGTYCIFDGWKNGDYTQFRTKYICRSSDFHFYSDEVKPTCDWAKVKEKSTIKDFIKIIERSKGGKLNLKTLEIEKQPKFKDGDFVYIPKDEDEGTEAIIFIYKNQDPMIVYCHAVCRCESYTDNLLSDRASYVKDATKARLATEEEKNLLLSKLANIGKKWNPDTKQIEDLPKPCEFKPFDRVLVRDTNIDKWEANLFSNYKEDKNGYHYVCVYGEWKQCVPYGGNEHLLDTRDSPEK